MKFSEKIKQREENRKFILFRFSTYLVQERAKNKFSRFTALVLIVAMLFGGVFFGTYFSDIFKRDRLVGRYTYLNVSTVPVSTFRQELTEVEKEMDYDSDGLTNEYELNNKLDMYMVDSNYDGVDDATAETIPDEFGVNKYDTLYERVFYNEARNIWTSTDKNEVKVEITFDSYDTNNDTLMYLYNGGAFDGFQKLTKPIIVENYNDSANITSDALTDFCKKNQDNDNSSDYKVIALSYDMEKDEYDTIGTWNVYSISETLRVEDVPEGKPFCIIAYKIAEDESHFDVSGLSFQYTILSNRIGNKTFTVAKQGEDENITKIEFFDKDKSTFDSCDKYYMSNVAKSLFAFSTSGMFEERVTSFGIQQKIESEDGEVTEESPKELISDKDKKETLFDTLRASFKKIISIGTIKGAAIIDLISEKDKLVKISSDSVGYASVVSTKFSVAKNAFSFTNYSDENNKYGFGVSMAEVISNYYNFGTLPETSNSDSVLKKFKLNGVSSQIFTSQAKLYSDYSVLTLQDEDVKKFLSEVNQNVFNTTYLTRSNSHAKDSSVIMSVIDYLKKDKTVVAYMRCGGKMTAVVVYAVSINDINPNKYTLYVYDPNFPNSKVSVKDEETGEVTEISVPNTIKLEYKPYTSIDTENKSLRYNDKMEFEYGSSWNYFFGNSGNFKNGVFYVGGDICFKVPTDMSNGISNSFIS